MYAAKLPMALSFALGALLALESGAQAQPFGRGPQRVEVRGILKKIDAAGKKITIAQPGRGGDAEEKTFALGNDVEVAFDNTPRRGFFHEGKLADLQEGNLLALTLADDQKTVESIAAEGPLVRGMVKSVDPAKKSITVAVFVAPRRDEGPEEKTYTLVPGAEVAVDDGLGRRFSIKEAKLADIAAGTQVSLRLTVDQKQIVSALAEGTNLFGRIKSVDVGKKTVTLTVGQRRGDDAEEEKTLELAKDALVLIDDGRGRRLSVKEAKLDSLPAGSQAMARLSLDQKAVTLLRAEGPNMPGLVKAVDADKNTITIAIPSRDNPQEKTLPLAKGARITIAGNEAKLADIKITDDGPFVMLRLTLDQKTVQAVAVSGGR